MIEHENNRKRCQCFVDPGNGLALLGMPDTDDLQISNINIDSIDAEDAENSEWYINTSTAQESNTKQETGGAAKCCANTDRILKSTNNGWINTTNTQGI